MLSSHSPSPHVLDHFRLDLLLGQVQREHGFLPGGLQPIQVQLGQFQELAVRGKRAAGDQRVDVRVPVQEFAATRERVPRWIAATMPGTTSSRPGSRRLKDLLGRSGFIAAALHDLLGEAAVAQLFSPVRRPQHNGALERSNGVLKTYTHYHAISEGHPFRWDSQDVDHARQLANIRRGSAGHRGFGHQTAGRGDARQGTAGRRRLYATAITRAHLGAPAGFSREPASGGGDE